MLKKLIRGLVLAVFITAAGMALQCASDPAVTGDGGVVDMLLADLGLGESGVAPDRGTADVRRDVATKADSTKLDSIGPKADAAPSGVKRTVYQGSWDSSGKATQICGIPGSSTDFPSIQVFVNSANPTADTWFPTTVKWYVDWKDPNGKCINVATSTGHAGRLFRVVLVY